MSQRRGKRRGGIAALTIARIKQAQKEKPNRSKTDAGKRIEEFEKEMKAGLDARYRPLTTVSEYIDLVHELDLNERNSGDPGQSLDMFYLSEERRYDDLLLAAVYGEDAKNHIVTGTIKRDWLIDTILGKARYEWDDRIEQDEYAHERNKAQN
ncbi:hypothetical protein BJ508DRAFT_325313 [Ascobolus immersus RN42]|uniref:Uncharacterized protein n=1 Tax=Ascobolus immersus RN42 TaxID=1160509 RepID=A0A3N4IEE0_ASCIM|nr:hypothetical protein BJ508DRAFT_325313 [Ascobolus immersus RN42]